MISVEFEDASGMVGHFQVSRIISLNGKPFVDDATVHDQGERLTAIEVKHEEMTRFVLSMFQVASDAAPEEAKTDMEEKD